MQGLELKFGDKAFAIIVVDFMPGLTADDAVMKVLKAKKVRVLNMLAPSLNLDNYSKAYSVLVEFGAENGFKFLIADPLNGILRTIRDNGTEPKTRIVRLIEIDRGEIHARPEITAAERAATENDNDKEG